MSEEKKSIGSLISNLRLLADRVAPPPVPKSHMLPYDHVAEELLGLRFGADYESRAVHRMPLDAVGNDSVM